MAFAKILTFLNSILSAQTIEPLTKNGGFFWVLGGRIVAQIGEFFCELFYGIVKWILALVDFLQYFVQKLIGLDYWLNNNVYSFEGAIENDILFSFLYNDTVQNVFRAMCGVFIVLLIVFTIFAIIKSEWTYITGENFGDGKGNSKSKIMVNAMKAIAWVLVFPLVLMIGIISSNAILASLVKALSIDMGSTFGSTLFYIGSQSANKYKIYADGGVRTPVSDQVTFYMVPHGTQQKYLTIGAGSPDEFTYPVATYADYVDALQNAKKYTVKSIFERNMMSFNNSFSGYCVRLYVDGNAVYYMVECSEDDQVAMYYYLRNVLQVPIMNKNDNIGNSDILKEVKGNMIDATEAAGFIKDLDLRPYVNSDEITRAVWNTWYYSSIYQDQNSFESATDVSVLLADNLKKMGIQSVSNAKVMYNSSLISSYFDGGMFGAEQLQAEYNVMGEVVDFMNNTGTKLYILDASSPLINWEDTKYQVDSRWLADFSYTSDALVEPALKATSNKHTRYVFNGNGSEYNTGNYDEVMPLLVSYSEMCADSEQGNVLYNAVCGKNNELEGSIYIMCIKQTKKNGTQAEYIPLVNGKTYENPVDKSTFNFKSDYYASNYRGVVIAKGTFDTSSTDGSMGLPTYLKSANEFAKNKKGTKFYEISTETPYYYEMEQSGGILQFAIDRGIATNEYNIESLSFTQEDYIKKYTIKKLFDTEGLAYIEDNETANKTISAQLVQDLKISVKTTTGDLEYTATYAGEYYTISSMKMNFLFKIEQTGEYFIVEATYPDGIRIKSISATGDIHGIGMSETFMAATNKYHLLSVYKNGASLTPGSGPHAATFINELRVDQFLFSGRKNGKAIFRSEGMEWVADTETSEYIYAFFNTGINKMISLEETKINFAKPVEPSKYMVNNPGASKPENLGYVLEEWDVNYMQNSVFFTFYLYNYYTAYVDASRTDTTPPKLHEYVDGGLNDNVSKPSKKDETRVFYAKVNADGFEFHTNEDSLGLYDGGDYVGTIYKPIGVECSNISQLVEVSTSMYFNKNKNTYDNLTTTNTFASTTEMKNYYDNLSDSFVTACVRTNLKFTFAYFDFGIKNWHFRFNWDCFGIRHVERDNISKVFKVSDGLAFDYFFENDIGLQTFYIPSKISYWVILIASALIIKVLGTSIWGVIKRFYEITLYFVAMPAVASTIPLDNGSRFSSSIQRPIILKVLMTYGVILGINLFFVLLAPIKSISNIFTPEDIATSGSYFLKHLPISYKLLNLYVYILFILVAFTMINALPSMISQIVSGGEDIMKSGSQVKQDVGKSIKEAGDVISGKGAMKAVGDVWEGAKSAIPGAALIGKAGEGIKKLGGMGIDAIKRGVTKGKEETGDSDPKSRGPGDEEEIEEDPNKKKEDPKTPPIENQIPVGETLTDDQILEAAKQGMSVVSDGKGGFMVDPNSVKPPEGEEELTPEQEEKLVENEFNENILDNENIIGNKEEVEKNAVENNTDKEEIIAIVQAMLQNFAKSLNLDGSTAEQINTVLFGGDMKDKDGNDVHVQGKVDAGAQVAAITSTMSEEERQNFEKAHANDTEEQKLQALQGMGYELQANVDQNGNVQGFNVVNSKMLDENGKPKVSAVSAEVQANILSNAVSNSTANEVAVATTQTGSDSVVSQIVANDVMQGIDIKNVDSTSALAGAITAYAMQDDTVIDEAMLDSMTPKELEKFMKKYQIKGDISDPAVRAQALQTISQLRHSDKGKNEFNTMDPSKYEGKVFEVVQRRAEKGEFSVTAWELQKMMDPNSVNEMIEKSKANRKSQSNDIVDGTNKSEHQAIIANVAQNLIDANPNSPMAKILQNAVFAGQLTSQDLSEMNLDTIKAITGKNSIAELTDEDKALLGFIKTKNGGSLTGANGEMLSEDEIKKFKGSFNNFIDRQQVYDSFDQETKVNAFEKSGLTAMLENTAKNDVTMAVDKLDLLRMETDYVLSGKMTENELKALSNLAGVEDITKLDPAQIDKILQDNSAASEIVRKSMKNDETTMEVLSKKVNKNYEKTYNRTDDEKAYELELSKQEIKAGSVDTIYQAFMNSNVVQGEEKTEMIKNMLAAFNNGQNSTQDVMAQLKALGVDEAQIAAMKRAGFSEEDIAMAYQAAALSGNADGLRGTELASMVSGYLTDTDKMQKDLLAGMQQAGGDEYKRAVDSLINQNLSEEQKDALVENVANSSINGFSKEEQDKIMVAMAQSDGEMMDKIRASLGLGSKDPVSEAQILAYLNNDANKDDRETLEKRANKMSYYELNHRFVKKDVSSAEELYKKIEDGNKTTKEVDKIIASQGDLIDTQRILEQLKAEGKDSDAIKLIAEKYAQGINVLTNGQKEAIGMRAKLTKIREVLGANSVLPAELIKKMGLDESKLDVAAAGAALEYIQGNHNDAYIELLRTNPKFNYLKNMSINDLSDAKKVEVYNELMTGKYGSLSTKNNPDALKDLSEIKKIKETAERNYVVEQFVQQDEQNGEILNVAVEELVEKENKRLLALGEDEKSVAIAKTIWNNKDYKKVKKEAADLFKELNNGMSIDEVDEQTRNNFLVQHFSDSLKTEDLDKIDKTILMNRGVTDPAVIKAIIDQTRQTGGSVIQAAINMGAIEDIADEDINQRIVEKMGVNGLNQVMENINKEELGEGKGTDVINGIKRKVVENIVEKQHEADVIDVVEEEINKDRKAKTGTSKLGRDLNQQILEKALLDAGIDFSKLSGAQKAMLRMANGDVQTDMSLLTPEQIAENVAKLKHIMSDPNSKIAKDLEKNSSINSALRKDINKQTASVKIDDSEYERINVYKKEVYTEYAKSNSKIMDQVREKTNERSVVPDVSKMTREQKRDFDYNLGILHEQVKKDSKGNYTQAGKDIITNLFLNTQLVNENEILEQMIKMQTGSNTVGLEQKIEILKHNAEFMRKVESKANASGKKGKELEKYKAELLQVMASTATSADLKKGLQQDTIMQYMSKNENVQQKLIMMGANNLNLTLDEKAQNEKKVEAVKKNSVLNNQVIEERFKNVDEDTIKKLIQSMLKQQDPDKFNKMTPDQLNSYINANYMDLKTELAMYKIDTTTGTVGKYDEKYYLQAIKRLERSNKLFKDQVYKNVTHSVSYAAHATEEEKEIFFTSETNKRINEAYNNTDIEGGIAEHFRDKKRRLQDGIEDFIAGGSDPNINFGEIYSKKRRLPKTSAAYENWNKALNKKIDEIKRGVGEYANMTKGEKQAEIAKLESRIIYLNDQKPKNYDKMSLQEKMEFDEQQLLNKNDAINAGDYSKIYAKKVKVSTKKTKQVSDKFVEENGSTFTYGTKIDTKRKKKHNDDLIDIDEKISRYNATKHVRRKEKDFGTNFEEFASSYLTPNQLKTLMKRYGLATDDQYKQETDQVVKIAMREKRERAMALYLNELRRTAARKVQKDGKKPLSFLVERGIDVDTAVYGSIRYKDGSKKYNRQQSKIQKEAHRKRVRKRSDAARIASENAVISNERITKELLEFNKNYKGPAGQYINEFKKVLAGMKIDTDGIDSLISKFRAKNALFGNIQTKPLAVQQRELLKLFNSELAKAQRRLKAPRNIIPASSKSEAVGKFVGKTLAGSTTKSEIQLHSQYATDFDKAMTVFARNASQVVDIRTLIHSLPMTVQSAIKNNLEDKLNKEQNMQERMKMLEKFLKRELAKAKRVVNKDNFFKSERHELEKLGSLFKPKTYVRREAVQNSTMYGPAFARLNSTDQKVHESLLANETAIKNKLKLEQDRLKNLIASLSNAKTISDRRIVRKSIESSETKVKLYKKMLDSAETRRREFEKSISDANDRLVKSRAGSIGASNRGSVLDEYIFTKGGVRVEKGSIDARQIDQIIKRYMANQAAIFNKMSSSYTHKAVSDLKVKIDRLRYSMTNDFGKNLRDLKRVQTELKEALDALQSTNKAEYDEIITRLKNDDLNLELVEKNLVQKLKQMGIDINEVRRYTNR